MDGITTPDGQIVMMTTNHPEKLDAALVRPGRVDKHYKLDKLDDYYIAEMFKRFYNEELCIDNELEPMTGADLQKIFMECRDAKFATHILESQ